MGESGGGWGGIVRSSSESESNSFLQPCSPLPPQASLVSASAFAIRHQAGLGPRGSGPEKDCCVCVKATLQPLSRSLVGELSVCFLCICR